MSSISPASVLFDINGNAMAMYNDTAISGSTTPSLLISGYDGYNGVSRYAKMGELGNLGVSDVANQVTVLSNATITAGGADSFILQSFGTQQISILVNIIGPVTGTSPVLNFFIREVDPSDGISQAGGYSQAATGNITGASASAATLTSSISPAVRVIWTVSGTTPSFGGVYVTIVTKSTPSVQAISGSITVSDPANGTPGTAPPSTATYTMSLANTSAPAMTNGDAYPLSLTTGGLLRIDGVYPLNTTTPTSDATFMAAAVTAAPPAYTDGQLSALSLNTRGQLRIDAAYPSGTVTAVAVDMVNSGGVATTAAPTYTTGTANPLSLDTSGNLRVSGFVTVNKASTSTNTTVAASTGTQTLLASNTNRLGATIFNGANKNLYILLGSGASGTVYTIILLPSSYWEIPESYTGIITGVWANGVGATGANISELTA